MSKMNKDGDNKLLSITIHRNDSYFLKLKTQIKESFFYFIFLLIKDGHHFLYLECISIAYQYLQMFYFPFDSYVKINIYYKVV